MDRSPHIPESVLVRIWEQQYFQPESLTTTDGQAIQVIRRGRRNFDNGPDFLNALLRIGERMYEGDVELHLEIGDWTAHGHDIDPSYNRTILHVVLWESRHGQNHPIRTAQGGDIPTIIVQHRLIAPIEHLLEIFRQQDERNAQKIRACQTRIREIPLDQIVLHLRQLGHERLYFRARRFESWLANTEQNAFQQLLYEAICEGLGYSSNKRPFVELARRLSLAQMTGLLRTIQAENSADCLLWIQAMLFGVAGLLPATDNDADPETRDYTAALRSRWETIAAALDVEPMRSEEWHFFRLRPFNFPTRRIAALSVLIFNYTLQPVLDNYVRLLSLLSQHPELSAYASGLLERTFTLPAAGYWNSRNQFGNAAFSSYDRRLLGRSRIRDLLISAVFPVMLLYAKQTARADLETYLVGLYDVFPSPSRNQVTKTMIGQLFGHDAPAPNAVRTASVYQGMLQLAKYYCELPACAGCPFQDATETRRTTRMT